MYFHTVVCFVATLLWGLTHLKDVSYKPALQVLLQIIEV